MTNLYSILIYYKYGNNPILKKSTFDLSSFSFFVRKNIKEFMIFASSILVERTEVGQRVSVKENEYRCHVYIRSDLLSCVVVSNLDYLPRVALTLAANALDIYTSDFDRYIWMNTDDNYSYPPLDNLIIKYQIANNADPLCKIQSDLDDTKIILHDTIQTALEKGEILDDLVRKTDKLKDSSKVFYQTSKSANSCCNIM